MSTKTRYILLSILLVATAYSLAATNFNPSLIYEGLFVKPFFGQFLAGMWPLNWDVLPDVASGVLTTIEIAWAGTVIAIVFALPLSILAARNLTPTSALGMAVRFFFNVDRSVDVVIVALFLVAAIGLGPLAGVLAVAIHSVGSLGKLFTEALEAVDRGPVQAIESVGASRIQVLRWGVLPQVMPYLVSYILYRFELNIRVSVVLGIVGAGGVGYLLNNSIKQFQYHDVSMILFVIVVMVMAIDAASARIRKSVV